MHSPFRHITSVLGKSRPVHLTFFVTRRCNARCPFCFYLSAQDNPPRADRELSLAEIERISSSLGSLLWLAFSGGEVYLRDDIVEISRIFYHNNRPSIMLFPTNGLLPRVIREKTEQILRHCAKSVIAVKLSIDGLRERHDAFRNTPGSFDRTMETCRLLGELLHQYPNFEIGVNTVFFSENQDEMDGIIDFVAGLEHIRTHTISLVRGTVSDARYKRVDFMKYRSAIERLEQNLKGACSRTYRFRGGRLKAAQDILQRRLIHRTMQKQARLIPCYAGRLNVVLTETGDVYPCEILTERFGNVRDYGYDMRRVMTSDSARRVVDSIRDNRCYCTHECYFMTNILFNPRMYPALMREYLLLRPK